MGAVGVIKVGVVEVVVVVTVASLGVGVLYNALSG